jgi:hypothetical protein
VVVSPVAGSPASKKRGGKRKTSIITKDKDSNNTSIKLLLVKKVLCKLLALTLRTS